MKSWVLNSLCSLQRECLHSLIYQRWGVLLLVDWFKVLKLLNYYQVVLMIILYGLFLICLIWWYSCIDLCLPVLAFLRWIMIWCQGKSLPLDFVRTFCTLWNLESALHQIKMGFCDFCCNLECNGFWVGDILALTKAITLFEGSFELGMSLGNVL